jgi:hypothetical protein
LASLGRAFLKEEKAECHRNWRFYKLWLLIRLSFAILAIKAATGKRTIKRSSVTRLERCAEPPPPSSLANGRASGRAPTTLTPPNWSISVTILLRIASSFFVVTRSAGQL